MQRLPQPATVLFSGPAGSTLSSTLSDSRQTFGDSALFSSPFITAPPLPPGGGYQVMLGAQPLLFDLPDQSTAASKLLLPVPTVEIDGGGVVTRVTWSYHQGGNSNVSPSAVIGGQIRVQMVGTGPTCGPIPPSTSGFVYDSGALPTTATEHTMSCSSILWSNVTRLFIAYQDVYGNNVVVSHEK